MGHMWLAECKRHKDKDMACKGKKDITKIFSPPPPYECMQMELKITAGRAASPADTTTQWVHVLNEYTV